MAIKQVCPGGFILPKNFSNHTIHIMTLPKVSPTSLFCILVALAIVIFAVFSDNLFTWLVLDRAKVAQGDYWRILSCNFVHFGWAHTGMNLAAFAICAPVLFAGFSLPRFVALLTSCCIAVGICIYWFNPNYEQYAGLSGALHGLIVAGFFVNKRHPANINAIFIALVFAKIIYEHLPGYTATGMQQLLPVAVAYDAHMYGAFAGLAFSCVDFCWQRLRGNS